MRYLAIDLGEKRTGLAVGDDESGIATPIDVVLARDEEHRLGLIGQAIAEHQPDALVVGLPLNMDGSDGPGTLKSRRLADQLSRRFGLTAHLVDERLSSYGADQQMSGIGLTRKAKRSRRDALAAAVILRTFFESPPPTPGPG